MVFEWVFLLPCCYDPCVYSLEGSYSFESSSIPTMDGVERGAISNIIVGGDFFFEEDSPSI